jgi:Lrp/AsnC family leucine-responsive transcriptional regulator
MKKLDDTDRRILNIVQRGDSCVPRVNKIAKELGIPTATAHSRLKKLRHEGIIKGYHGLLDAKKVDKNLTIFTILKVVYSQRYSGKTSMTDFAEKLRQIPEVMEIYSCSADWDYLLKLKVKDTEDYNRVLTEELLPLGGIDKSESVVAYGNYKETPAIPL